MWWYWSHILYILWSAIHFDCILILVTLDRYAVTLLDDNHSFLWVYNACISNRIFIFSSLSQQIKNFGWFLDDLIFIIKQRINVIFVKRIEVPNLTWDSTCHRKLKIRNFSIRERKSRDINTKKITGLPGMSVINDLELIKEHHWDNILWCIENSSFYNFFPLR